MSGQCNYSVVQGLSCFGSDVFFHIHHGGIESIVVSYAGDEHCTLLKLADYNRGFDMIAVDTSLQSFV